MSTAFASATNEDEETQRLTLATHAQPLHDQDEAPTQEDDESIRRLREVHLMVFVAGLSLVLTAWEPVRLVGFTILCMSVCCLSCMLSRRRNEYQPSRVKTIAMHSQKPWILVAYYSGHVAIWKSDEQKSLRFLVSNVPVRAAQFVESRDVIVTGSDDLYVRIYDMEGRKLQEFEGHADYIRCLAAHPSRQYFLSSSDDLTIKLWDAEYNYNCMRTFEGHGHYVMQVRWDPRDHDRFATASLDRTIKVWSVDNPEAVFTLHGHTRGVNTIAFVPSYSSDPLLASGSDDKTIMIWNCQSRQHLCTVVAHTENVTAVQFHPVQPILVSTSEDGSVRFWDTQEEYQPLHALAVEYGKTKGRGWALGASTYNSRILVGLDKGCMSLQVTQESEKIRVVEDDDISKAIHDYEGRPKTLDPKSDLGQ